MFVASPSTIRTGGRPVRPAPPRRSRRRPPSPSASASRSTSRRNACGVCARKIVSRGSVSVHDASAVTRPSRAGTRFTVSRACTAASAAPDSAAAAIVRAIRSGADERPRRVVNDDDVARGRGAKRVRHRVLPPRAAGHDPQRLGRTSGRYAGRIVGELLRQRDDHLVDRRMREKRGDAALENRAAADRQQLLRAAPPNRCRVRRPR